MVALKKVKTYHPDAPLISFLPTEITEAFGSRSEFLSEGGCRKRCKKAAVKAISRERSSAPQPSGNFVQQMAVTQLNAAAQEENCYTAIKKMADLADCVIACQNTHKTSWRRA
jgi:hypothetical protein